MRAQRGVERVTLSSVGSLPEECVDHPEPQANRHMAVLLGGVDGPCPGAEVLNLWFRNRHDSAAYQRTRWLLKPDDQDGTSVHEFARVPMRGAGEPDKEFHDMMPPRQGSGRILVGLARRQRFLPGSENCPDIPQQGWGRRCEFLSQVEEHPFAGVC